MPDVMPGLGADLFGALGITLSAAIYARLVWHRHLSEDAKGDDQLGFKTVCATLAITGALMAAAGLQSLLAELLTWGAIKQAIQVSLPRVIVGAGAIGLVVQVFLPRTNHEQYPKAMRLTAGAVACIAGVMALISIAQTLSGLFMLEWKPIARGLAASVVSGGAAAGSLVVLSKLSGIETDDLTEGVSQFAHQMQQNMQGDGGQVSMAPQPMQQPSMPPQPMQQPSMPPQQMQQPSMPPQQMQQPSMAPQNPSMVPQNPSQPPQPGQFQPSRPPGPPPPGGFRR